MGEITKQIPRFVELNAMTEVCPGGCYLLVEEVHIHYCDNGGFPGKGVLEALEAEDKEKGQ